MRKQGTWQAKGADKRRFRRASLLSASFAAAALVAVPALGNVLAGKLDSVPVSLAARGGIGSFTPASVDPRLAAQFGLPTHGKLFRFTPAGSASRPNAVTVAIRVDGDEGRVISVRGALPASAMTPGSAAVRIAPTVYNLGAARGYQSFAAGSVAVLPREIERLDVPDLRSFTPAGATAAVNPGRLAPRIQIDEKERAGRAPRTLETQGDYQLDLGGSYRLTRNFNAIAGIRYSSERDRLRPLTDGKQDSQAVYVGTQFRF